LIIYDHDKFRLVAQVFLLVALIVMFISAYVLKPKNTKMTYNTVVKSLIIAFPIMVFPFMVLSTWSVEEKIIMLLVTVFVMVCQFYGTVAVRKLIKKTFYPTDKS
jgi:hypothetical protein